MVAEGWEAAASAAEAAAVTCARHGNRLKRNSNTPASRFYSEEGRSKDKIYPGGGGGGGLKVTGGNLDRNGAGGCSGAGGNAPAAGLGDALLARTHESDKEVSG